MIEEGTVLVVAAHPDDEALGCGGRIAGLAATRPVHPLFLADGETARDTDDGSVARRQAAATALGWKPAVSIDDGLARIVRWYLDRRDWWERILAVRYDAGRLGNRQAATGAGSYG